VNLGNPDEFTIRELAEQVVAQVGGGSSIVQSRDLPPDDPKQRRPDIALARSRLGWEPRVPLAAGLRRTIEYFRALDFTRYRPPTPNY
jgi:UDP-glucuronate decarboxylase